MKRYIPYIMVLVAGVFACSCTDKISPEEDLQQRQKEQVSLSVSFAVDGSDVTSLAFSHSAMRREIEVTVNNDNLYWNLESNRTWCTVVPGEHKGSGTIVLDISANEGFEPRDEATLTLVAGEYRGSTIKVNQSATAFIIGQPYFVVPVSGGSYTVNVTTLEGTSWTVDGGSWLQVTKGSSSTSGGFTRTPLTIKPSANSGASRYGAVTLKAGAEEDNIWLWQFGNDYSYDADGNVFFGKDAQAALHLSAPAYTVKDVQVPSFATATVTENGDGTASIDIALEQNYSDCSELRQADISILLNNASASVVAVPTIVQDYVPAHGLVTGKGLSRFAAAVNSGASTADWEQNGVVTVIQDIDMNGIDDWVGIGTADKPFTGSFNGGGKSINNLKNTASGLFNYCNGATIKDINLGKNCSIYNNAAFTTKGCLGGIVSVAEKTSISGCGFAGVVEFGGESGYEDAAAYVGGVVGWADSKSSIQSSGMSGKVVVSTPSAEDVTCYEGGIAGLCEGTLTSSEVLGQVSFSSGIGTAIVGGVESDIIAGATIGNNSFMGTVTLGGNAGYVNLGGLYGRMSCDHSFDSSSDKSVTLGNIEINSFRSVETSTCVWAGGFIGFVPEGLSLTLKGYEAQTNIQMDLSSAELAAKTVCLGGLLGGCELDSPANSLTFSGVEASGTIGMKYSTGVRSLVRRTIAGGVAGYVCGPANFTDCTNKGDVGKDLLNAVYCSRSNGYCQIAGGIAGYAHGGNAKFEKCVNQGAIDNHVYNNNGVTGVYDGMYTPPISGGILGGFNYGTTRENFQLSMTECTNANAIFSYRGYTGGIVGYCYNAVITSCSNQGRMSNGANDQNAYRGGIAGAAGKASVKDSWAICDITALVYGSADYGCGGGIVGLALSGDPLIIEGGSYFGTVKADKKATTKPEYPGGILGMGQSNSVVKNCRYGGNVQGVEISENNVSTVKNIVGNEQGSVTGTTYWNGKM